MPLLRSLDAAARGFLQSCRYYVAGIAAGGDARAPSVGLVELARADEIGDFGFSSVRSDDNCRVVLRTLKRQRFNVAG